MKAARFTLALSALSLAAGAPLASVEAQNSRTADPNAPRLMVGVFRAADKNVGVQAADAIRERITRDVPVRQLWVLPKQDLVNVLEASGFPTNEPLAPHDARTLAQQLRADAYIVGSVNRDSAGTGLVVNAQYVLTRDNKLVQPLPPVRVDKADKAAGAVSSAFRDAHKQFDEERQCTNLMREGKHAEAATAARKGITEYPNSTLSRLCLASAMKEMKAPAESILAVTNQVLAIDPRSQYALGMAYDTYKAANQNEQATDVLLRLVAADPSNSRNLEAVINELAGSGQAAKAVPFVQQLVRDNPGDPAYIGLQMRVLLAAKNYKEGIAAGEELMKLDTAAANADLFTRLAVAAVLDSQPQKGAEIAARGVAKFPNNADLATTYVDILRQAGQPQQALEALNRIIQANPKAPGAYLNRARFQSELNMPDSALASLKQALANGDSATSVALYALGLGQTAYRAAVASKARADYERASTFLDFAVQTNATPEGQFLLGANAYSLATAIIAAEINPVLPQLQRGNVPAATRTAVCEHSKVVQTALGVAQTNIPAGGRTSPQAAQQMLTQLGQLTPFIEQVAKAVCR